MLPEEAISKRDIVHLVDYSNFTARIGTSPIEEHIIKKYLSNITF
jgi:hypothetical protein